MLTASGWGARGGNAVVIVIANQPAQESSSYLLQASEALQSVASVIAIGVGPGISGTELITIAGDTSKVFQINFNDLEAMSFVSDVANFADCKEWMITTNPTITSTNMPTNFDTTPVVTTLVSTTSTGSSSAPTTSTTAQTSSTSTSMPSTSQVSTEFLSSNPSGSTPGSTTEGTTTFATSPLPSTQSATLSVGQVSESSTYSTTDSTTSTDLLTVNSTDSSPTTFEPTTIPATSTPATTYSSPVLLQDCTQYRDVDVVFVVASDSFLGLSNWNAMLNFIANIVDIMNIGETNTRLVLT